MYKVGDKVKFLGEELVVVGKDGPVCEVIDQYGKTFYLLEDMVEPVEATEKPMENMAKPTVDPLQAEYDALVKRSKEVLEQIKARNAVKAPQFGEGENTISLSIADLPFNKFKAEGAVKESIGCIEREFTKLLCYIQWAEQYDPDCQLFNVEDCFQFSSADSFDAFKKYFYNL